MPGRALNNTKGSGYSLCHPQLHENDKARDKMPAVLRRHLNLLPPDRDSPYMCKQQLAASRASTCSSMLSADP